MIKPLTSPVLILSLLLSIHTPYINATETPSSNNTKKQIYISQENYVYPSRHKKRNLDIEVDGFYEVKISGRDHHPRSYTDPRWNTIINDPVYTKIPKNVFQGSMKPENRWNIKIDGKLDDNLTVHYDLVHEPDIPDKYDLEVDYKQVNLKFWDLNSQFKVGEFLNVNRSLRGVRFKGHNNAGSVLLAQGKSKSDPVKILVYGNGNPTFKLRNNFILEGTLKVELNNKKQQEGVDYSVDYYGGSVTFLTKRPQQHDSVKFVYEFTSPLVDFLPTLSKKSFFGLQGDWKQTPKTKTILSSKTAKETLWFPPQPSLTSSTPQAHPNIIQHLTTSSKPLEGSLLHINHHALSLNATLQHININTKNNTIMLTLDNNDTIRIEHTATITTNNNSLEISHLKIRQPQRHYTLPLNNIWISAPSISKDPAQPPPQSFKLRHKPLLLGKETLLLNSFALIRNQDYFIDHHAGNVSLKHPLNTSDNLSILYSYYPNKKCDGRYYCKRQNRPLQT